MAACFSLDSINSAIVIANALEMRKVTASVGFAFSRSISLNIDRDTPLACAKLSSDQPRSVRNFFTRRPRCSLMDSGRGGRFDLGVFLVGMSVEMLEKLLVCGIVPFTLRRTWSRNPR